MRRWLVVLISPQESGNVGAAARVLKNFGVGGLRIVAPRCEIHCNESRAFASGAAEILRRAEIFETLEEAIADRELTIGLTGVGGRHHRMDCIGLMPTKLLEEKDDYRRCALVFGREERGMETGEMELLDFLWSLPTQADFSSLNLAQAIAVALSATAEVERQRGLLELGTGVMPSTKSLNVLAGSHNKDDVPAEQSDMQRLGNHFERLMVRTGWEPGRRVKESVMTLRNLFARGNITKREVNLFHGLCKQSMLAIDNPENFAARKELLKQLDGEDRESS